MSWPPQESKEIQKAFAVFSAGLWWLDLIAVVVLQSGAIWYAYLGKFDANHDEKGWFYLVAAGFEAIAIGLAIPLVAVLAWRWLRRRQRRERTTNG